MVDSDLRISNLKNGTTIALALMLSCADVSATKRHAKLHTIVGMEALRGGKNRAHSKVRFTKTGDIAGRIQKFRCYQTRQPQKPVSSNFGAAKVGVAKPRGGKSRRRQGR